MSNRNVVGGRLFESTWEDKVAKRCLWREADKEKNEKGWCMEGKEIVLVFQKSLKESVLWRVKGLGVDSNFSAECRIGPSP